MYIGKLPKCQALASQCLNRSSTLRKIDILAPGNMTFPVQVHMHWQVFRPQGYKTFLCSTQLRLKLILLINVKMPTIVGILTFKAG